MDTNRDAELQTYWDGRVERELTRERDHPGKQVHTDLLQREIARCIGQRQGLAILDAGAGTGRFSLPLAQAGHRVVHLDISPGMLDAAREQALRKGVTGVTFVEGSIDDLSRFPDSSFDLTLCLDSPLSFCADRCETALRELVRVSRSTFVLCVINTFGVITEGGLNFDLQHFGQMKTTFDVYRTGKLEVTEELRAFVPTLMPTWKSFRPAEIRALLEANGCIITRLCAPGTLARFVEPELLRRLQEDAAAYHEFLDFADEFDADPDVLGIGAARAGGLLVTAEKRPGLGELS